MSRNALPVDELLCWARRDGELIKVGLRLPGAELEPGAAEVLLVRRNDEHRVDAEISKRPEAVDLEFAVPQSMLGPHAWSLSLQAGPDDRIQRLEARLLGRPGQPVAVLPGPAPATKMPPPSPRRPRPSAPPPSTGRSWRSPLGRLPLAHAARGVARRARRTVSGLRRAGSTGEPKDGPSERGAPDTPAPEPRLQGPALFAARAANGQPIVVLTDSSTQAAVAAWLPALPDAKPVVLRMVPGSAPKPAMLDVTDVTDLDDVERRLFSVGSPAVLIVALPQVSVEALAGSHRRLFARLFPQVRQGGAYIAYDLPANRAPSPDAADGRLETAGQPQAGSGNLHELAARAASPGVQQVVERPGFVLLRQRRRHALMLREEEAGRLLPDRQPGVTVSILESRPGGSLPVAGTETSHGPAPEDEWPDRLTYPELTLRHYRGDLTSHGSMLLTADATILPESFRWPHSAQLGNPSIHAAGPTFSRIPRSKDAPVLEGDFYYLDCLFSGHFGHLLTEVVCRLWGWDVARAECPDLKALFHTNPRRSRHGTLEHKLFTAYGIPEADLVATPRPVRLHSVVGASPMWHNAPPFYVHPDIREVWERLTSGLLAGRPPSEHERIFVSRGDELGRRRCRNQGDVERFFADHGFHVFYPERLPLDEQVALFAGARVVAGFAGSALFNMMHCRRLEKTVVISQNDYEARNENLFNSVLGGQLHYFWQESDLAGTEGVGNKQARRASYAFDFDRYGAELTKAITEP
jgi:capsular polysaccharide biosynthesis protein